MRSPSCWARSTRPSFSITSIAASAAAHDTGIAAERAAEAADVDRVHDLGPAGQPRPSARPGR